jgi:hypothetical protein
METNLFCEESVFWDVTPCTLVEVDQHFKGMFCLHVQCQRVSQASSSCFFLGWLTFQHWRRRMYVSSKTVNLYQATQHHIAEASTSTSQSLSWKPLMNFFSHRWTHWLFFIYIYLRDCWNVQLQNLVLLSVFPQSETVCLWKLFMWRIVKLHWQYCLNVPISMHNNFYVG